MRSHRIDLGDDEQAGAAIVAFGEELLVEISLVLGGGLGVGELAEFFGL
ncbi:hypothetical protein JQ607_33970 [Bradyrhizobium liaoningense]|nr:hypothetical protein [Bradyrhizobium liaoningense]MBR0845222.1 hypothetical protein [Bradyrhizobium liaoningense]